MRTSNHELNLSLDLFSYLYGIFLFELIYIISVLALASLKKNKELSNSIPLEARSSSSVKQGLSKLMAEVTSQLEAVKSVLIVQ